MNSSQSSDLSRFVSDALDVVEFKLIRERSDIEDDSTKFHPEMAHQIVGDTERIFGYKDLNIKLYYTAGPLHIYFGIDYTEKVEPSEVDAINADDVTKQITELLPEGCYYTNLDEFLMTLDRSEAFKPYGEKVMSFEITKNEIIKKFEIFKCEINSPKFQSFYARLQTFVLWFIDAACYIDTDDPVWTIFVVYEKYSNSQGQDLYATIGYATIYQYYAYPEHIRPRISQMLILPPFQNQGVGIKLIEAIYNFYIPNSSVLDISVEGPSETFTRIRNYVDVKLCKSLSSFSPEKLRLGFSKDMINEAQKKVKINKKQCRIVYEILRLMHTNMNDENEYKAYRLDIKKRLNMSYYKARSDLEKIKAKGIDVTAAVAMIPTIEEKVEQLKLEYKEIEENYIRIMQRLAD